MTERKLVVAIINFLKSQLHSMHGENAEALDVSIQCLENAYNITNVEESDPEFLPLLDIFENYNLEVNQFQSETVSEDALETNFEHPAFKSAKEEAENYKSEGNLLMHLEPKSSVNFSAAVKCYTKAVAADSKNPVYYCNRAAAHYKLENYRAAIADCNYALKLDPLYSKAHGRLGLAYTSLGMDVEARNCFKRALDLEPDNAGYQYNYDNAEFKLTSATERGIPVASGISPNFDLTSVLNNPSIISMATQMLSDPALQNVMSNIISGGVGEQRPGFDSFVHAGQQLAQHMQSENPEMIDELRRQLNSKPDGDEKKGPSDPPNPPE